MNLNVIKSVGTGTVHSYLKIKSSKILGAALPLSCFTQSSVFMRLSTHQIFLSLFPPLSLKRTRNDDTSILLTCDRVLRVIRGTSCDSCTCCCCARSHCPARRWSSAGSRGRRPCSSTAAARGICSVRRRTCRTGDTRAWALPSGIIVTSEPTFY